MRDDEPDHKHREADDERQGDVDPEEAINGLGWEKPTGTAVSSSVGVNPGRPVMLTVISDSADQDCGETENYEGTKDTLGWILDEPQGFSRVEKELS